MTEIDPSQSLYITNLNGRVTVEELKSSLYGLFSTYGLILDITTKKTFKMREQAFIVYDNVASASTAKRGLNGFTFFDRPIKIEYAKTKSDVVAKLDGTYKLRTHDTKSTGANGIALGQKRSSEEEDHEGNGKMARTEESDDDSDDHA